MRMHCACTDCRSLLRAMDFQPRLGVVTRALQLAAPDLLHFALVAGAVFLWCVGLQPTCCTCCTCCKCRP